MYTRCFEDRHTVLTAPDGLAGLELARTRRPDVILLDIHLPGADGLTVFKELKRDAGTAAIRVILITGLALPETILPFIAEGLHTSAVFQKATGVWPLIERVESELRGNFDLEFDAVSHAVSRRGSAPLHLGSKKFLLLRELAADPGGVSCERLIRVVWSDIGDKAALHATVKRLREDLAGLKGCRIMTLKDGYRLVIKPSV